MDRIDFLKRLDELLELKPGTLSPEDRLQDLEGWDSLAVMGFIALADEHYSVILSPQQLASCKSVGELIQLVDGGR